MNKRVLLAFLGLIVVVGAGSLWLALNILKRKKLVKNLLSLPKERRFFWFKLRQAGYQIVDYDREQPFVLDVNGEARNYNLKVDFVIRKDGKRYIGLFAPVEDDKELLKAFFVYCQVFKVNGVIFYKDNLRSFMVWER